MPGRDGMGPRGEGPRTGGGFGSCGSDGEGSGQPGRGRGRGYGRGGGGGRGFGRGRGTREGRGFGRGACADLPAEPMVEATRPADEAAAPGMADVLQAITALGKRIEKLEAAKADETKEAR